MSTVYLNGEFVPLNEARVSVLDRGFLFADGVYEVMPAYNGRVFRVDEHLQRLENSLRGIYMQNPLSLSEWKHILEQIVEKNTGKHQSLYLQVTRGVSERDHFFDADLTATVFIMSKPLKEKNRSDGIAAILTEDTRWKHCDLKTIALLPGVLLRHMAREKGASEAILFNDDQVTEGAASNVFVIHGETMKTPPKSNNILPGVTRDLVVELCAQNNLDLREESITVDEIKTADEIWVTSSTQEIIPVIKLDGQAIGNGQPGAMYERVNDIYQSFKENF